MTNACTWKPSTVTLADGRQVLSDSPEWRHECEARTILDMPNKQVRLELLDKIEKRRGANARRELEQSIMTLWHARRAADATA